MENYIVHLLFDPESNHTYEVHLNKEDSERVKSDAVFAQALLSHAKCTNNVRTKDVECVELVDSQQSQLEDLSTSSPSQSSELLQQKRKRFRFTDNERNKCIRELFGILAEDRLETEEELWSQLHQILMHDNAHRFTACSLRLLKEHILEQVARYRKLDSIEASESGKERLQTEWGDNMRDLMLVWENYSKLAVQKVKNPVGRPRKPSASQDSQNVALATQIRDTAMKTLSNNDYSRYEQEDKENNEPNDLLEAGSSSDTTAHVLKSQHSPYRVKKRGSKDSTVFSYLAEKANMSHELEKEKLKLKEKKHLDQIRLQEETLEFKRQKLEFDKEKWTFESQQRAAEAEKNNLLLNFLAAVVKEKI